MSAIRAIARAAGPLAFAASAGVHSQQLAVFRGGETVVTASRIEQRVEDVPRAVTVITAEDIARSGQLSLAEVLQQFGGLEMAASGGTGTATTVFIRGANAAHTLVLVDGVRLQSATTGSTAFGNIPLAQVERIEIVPGPASSLYGSDAVGGVIQIFTKGGGAKPGAEVAASGGTYSTGALKASGNWVSGGSAIALAAGYFDTGGYSVTRPTISFGRHNPDDDPYRNASASAKATQRLGDRHVVGASAFVSDGRSHFDNGATTDDRIEQKLATYGAHWQARFTDAWESTARVGASRDDIETLGGSFPSRFVTDQSQATWQNTFTVAEGVALLAGAEYLRQEVEGSTTYDVTRRSVTSIFAGANAALGAHALLASVRRDDNSQFGTPTTGSIAYGYRLTPAIRARAAYGTAFHAPSFNDLYFPGFGNPGLEPERSRNREAGLDWSPEGHRLAATYFDNEIRDLIVLVFDSATQLSRPENVARARIRGLELSYAGTWMRTLMRAKLTLQEPESEPSGAQLQRRARQHGSLVATRAFGAWSAGVEVVASGERFDSSNEAPASRMAGYGVVNLTLARVLAPGWSAELRWNNVGDKEYTLIQGFNPPGSNALLTVRWTPR